ncbi:hypothetical protein LUZ60_007508 [Juncus effusus]|nr:hypothetical protein LUZ60_007508 [Juncus effusus]
MSPAPQSPTSSATLSLPAAPSNPPPSSYYSSISKARSSISLLSSLLPASAPPLLSLADSDRPALSLLASSAAYSAISSSLSSSSSSSSGSSNDPLCHWLYDTYLSSDPDLRLIPLSFLPVISSLYLSRLPSRQSPLSGFEAVILAIYSSEVKSRGGKSLSVSVPDLTLPSLYHSPPKPSPAGSNPRSPRSQMLVQPPSPSVSELSPPLEPQIAVKSTKRASILAACFDAYYSKIALMPPCSKVDLCNTVANWAGQNCPCRYDQDSSEDQHNSELNISSPASSSSSIELNNHKTLDDFEEEEETEISNQITNLGIEEGSSNGSETGQKRVPLPWDLLQPLMRVLGHCLLAPMNPQEVRDAASVAVRCVYARAAHELIPQAILASRSLIQLDKSAREAATSAASLAPQSSSVAGSNATTPSKQKRSNELMMVSK